MEKRTREILAVVLLVVLGGAVACAMGWYILVGHNWNQAATHIDDLVGSMDGYTVIVYDGIVEEPLANGSVSALRQKKAVSAGVDSAHADLSGGAPPKSASSGSQAASSKSRTKLSAASVAKSYREKGASVITIDLQKLSFFDDPSILKRSGKRFGIFATSGEYRKGIKAIRDDVRYLNMHEVDTVVMLSEDPKSACGRNKGVDLLVVAGDAGLPSVGKPKGQTLCVDSPAMGEVQAVIISPSGFMTSRTLSDL